MFSVTTRIVALVGLLAATAAHALPTPLQTYYAENQSPGNAVTADVLAKRTAFLGALVGPVSSFGFERPAALPGDTSGLSASFTSSTNSPIVATINGNGVVVAGNDNGRFNTTTGGTQYWRVQSGSTGTFSINFSSAISAFGFYGTDIGDLDGTLTLLLTRASDGVVERVVVHDTVANSGSLLFYGFADASSAYSQITFTTTGSGTDYFGFDDFVVADARQVRLPTGTVPEPESLALVGCALIAAGWAGKSRRR